VQAYVVANKDGPVDQGLMVEELLKLITEMHLRSVQVAQLAVTQDVTVVEDFQVGYAGQADFVCVHQVEQKRLLNVGLAKVVHTAGVKCLTADVLTVLH